MSIDDNTLVINQLHLNPEKDFSGDCLVQCLLKLEDLPASCWKSLYSDLYTISSLNYTVFNAQSVILEYLKTRCSIKADIKYERYYRRAVNADDEENEFLSVVDFIDSHKNSTMLIGLVNHIILYKDGQIYDTDSVEDDLEARVRYSYEIIPKKEQFEVSDVVWIPDLRVLRGLGLAIVTEVTEQKEIKTLFLVHPDVDKNRKETIANHDYVLDYIKDLRQWERNVLRKTGLQFNCETSDPIYQSQLLALTDFNDILNRMMIRYRSV